MPLRVLHLVGSPVSEFFADLSRLYAEDCLRATADMERYDVHLAYVSPGGEWCFPRDLTGSAIEAVVPMCLEDAIAVITGLRIDAVVPQMFCLPGMTTYRALFDLLGIPCLGNAPEAMALAANKARAKAVVAAAGVDVPAGQLLRRGDTVTVPVPLVVKPVDSDNSLGLSLVRYPSELGSALNQAFRHADEVLVEEYVELGREVRCGVLEVGGELVCLPLEEYAVDSGTKPVRDRADKLLRGEDGLLTLVAKDVEHAWIVPVDDPVTERVWAAARACHVALGCRDYSLFDFRIDPDGRPWFLEAGLYCSFAEQSVISVMAGATGMPVPELFLTVLERCLTRSGERLVRFTVQDPIGVEVTGLDLHDLTSVEVTAVEDLLAHHGVAVFPDQEIGDEDFVGFLGRFGPLVFTTGETPVPGTPDLNIISNVGRKTPPRSTFHVDSSYLRHPPAYTALRAVSIPSEGGETLFTNQYDAFDSLTADLVTQLEGRTVTHVVTGLDLTEEDETEAEHPIFARHPISGRTSLYLSTPARCQAISGMSPALSEVIISRLYAHSTREENTFRHRWAPGHVVMWDNRVVLHRADHAGVVGDRVMHRGMVLAS